MRILFAVSVVAGTTLSQPAMTADTVPDRCAYVYAAAAYNVANLVFKQVTEFGDPDATQRAHIAVQLTRNLECPVEPMLKAIDCAVALVRKSGGTQVTEPQTVGCVSAAMGHPFPQLGG